MFGDLLAWFFCLPALGAQARASWSWAAVSRAIAVASATVVMRVQPASRYRRAVTPSMACTPTGLPAAAQAAQTRCKARLSTGSSGSSCTAQGERQVPGTDVEAVDPVDGQGRLELGESGGRLDHNQAERLGRG